MDNDVEYTVCSHYQTTTTDVTNYDTWIVAPQAKIFNSVYNISILNDIVASLSDILNNENSTRKFFEVIYEKYRIIQKIYQKNREIQEFLWIQKIQKNTEKYRRVRALRLGLSKLIKAIGEPKVHIYSNFNT